MTAVISRLVQAVHGVCRVTSLGPQLGWEGDPHQQMCLISSDKYLAPYFVY